MAGNQTHGFDLAIEFSENFFNQFLGATLDTPTNGGSNSLLCQLLTGLGHPELCGNFGINVLMSRPADLSIPANAKDFLDIHITAGIMTIRMVVGIITDRSQADADIFILDFQNHLLAAKATLLGVPLPDNSTRALVSSTFKQIPLPSIPLNGGRASTDPKNIIRADTRVIDDTSAADLNAWSILLTFGGGTPGDLNAFTQSVIPAGGNGAIVAFFDWITRILSPALAGALGMDPSNIMGGHLVNPFLIDSDNDVTLTKLDLTLVDDFIQVSCTVTKSGFCYDASGTLTARLKLAIENDAAGVSHILVKAEIDDPDINVDIPWYCWIAGAVIGALLGGVLFGVIGAIVGGILVPLITWIASEVVNGVIDDVTGVIGDAINSILPNVDVAIPGLSFVFTDAHIDDILIKASIQVHDVSPIKCSGAVLLNNGQYLDLDTGTVESDDTAGADIQLAGSGFVRVIKTVCRTTLARTWQRNLAGLARFNCYTYPYQLNAIVPLGELAEFDVWGLLWGDKYDETEYVYAVVTNENRYSLFRVTTVTDSSMRIEYKTFGVAQSLSLTGGFTCGPDWKLSESLPLSFAASPVLLQSAGQRDAAVLQVNSLQRAAANPGAASVSAPAAGTKATASAGNAISSAVSAVGTKAVVGISGASIDANVGRLGTFTGQYTAYKNDTGRFIAQAQGLAAPITYFWAINGNPLEGDSGSVTTDGKKMNWAVNGNQLLLTPVDRLTFEFELKVAAVDARGTALSKIKCVKYVPLCKVTKRALPPFKLYQTHYSELWGRAEVPLKNLAVATVGVGRA